MPWQHALAPPGVQTYRVSAFVSDAGPTVVTLSVGDASVGPQPLDQALELVVSAPGDFTAFVAARCGDRVVGELTIPDRIYPAMRLTHSFPRACEALAVVDAGRFDCDGVVIDEQGVEASGEVRGDDAQVLQGVRWTRANGELQRGGARVAFPAARAWAVAEDFSIAGDSLAELTADGGLTVRAFDAGLHAAPDFELCAARSDGTSRAVAFCQRPFLVNEDDPRTDRAFVICALSASGLSGCQTLRALFIRQEAASRRVLLRRAQELFWIDLLAPMAETPALQLREREFLDAPPLETWGRQSPLFHSGQVTRAGGVLTREERLRVVVLDESVRVRASTELLWTSDAGVTRWDWLP